MLQVVLVLAADPASRERLAETLALRVNSGTTAEQTSASSMLSEVTSLLVERQR